MRTHFSIIRIGSMLLYSSCLLNILIALGVIAAWNSTGQQSNYDALAISLTVLEVLLAIIAAGGFWLIRGSAIRASELETRAELGRKLPEELEKHLPSVLANSLPSLVRREAGRMVPTAVAEQMRRLEDAVLKNVLDELKDRGVVVANELEWGILIDPSDEDGEEK